MPSFGTGRAHSTAATGEQIAAHPIAALHQGHAILLLRWVLIVATCYLVVFSRPLSEVTPLAGLFVAAYLASNVALAELMPRLRSAGRLEWILMVVDTLALTLAVALTQATSSDLFVLYFAVLFVSALSERLGLVVGAAVLITVAHLYTLTSFVDLGTLIAQGYLVRIPFLFAVALFFGHLVHHARGRERALEDARARDLRLDLLSSVSHDLKNPLGVIDSLADLLLDGNAGPLNDQQADLTRRIRASTRQVISLSQNLIDAERVEAGRLVLQRQPTSITRVIDNALIVASTQSEIKGVALRVSIEPGLPSLALDGLQMERVIANLLGNAIKFTPSGGRVRLTARRQCEALVVAVTDDGPGIAAADLPHLSERHFRGSRSALIEGSGLGLFIVRAVIEAHGGSVRIASGVGDGTTVTIALPFSAPRADTAPAPADILRVAPHARAV